MTHAVGSSRPYLNTITLVILAAAPLCLIVIDTAQYYFSISAIYDEPYEVEVGRIFAISFFLISGSWSYTLAFIAARRPHGLNRAALFIAISAVVAVEIRTATESSSSLGLSSFVYFAGYGISLLPVVGLASLVYISGRLREPTGTPGRRSLVTATIVFTNIWYVHDAQASYGVTFTLMAFSLLIWYREPRRYIAKNFLASFSIGLIVVLLTPFASTRVWNSILYRSDSAWNYEGFEQRLVMAAGGWFGRGITAHSTVIFLPNPFSVDRFSVLVAATGFVGGLVILLLFLSLITICFSSYVRQARLLWTPIFGAWVAVEVGCHVLVNLGVLPPFSVWLPFMNGSLGMSIVMGGLWGASLREAVYCQRKRMELDVPAFLRVDS
jgi:cell division protein FtsW (lipid II flippase)